MAKCIRKGDEVKRVKDDEAEEFIKKGWKYIPKGEYKRLKGDD
jgi:hypothetical protein